MNINHFTGPAWGMWAAILLVLSAGSASAQSDPRSSPHDYSDCQQVDDVARAIAACSRIAGDLDQAAADRVVAYRWLGNDHMAAGVLDQAIADYSNAIRLDPQSASTYVSRALANSQKGDRMAAIADYRQAVVIDPARVGGMADVSAELRAIAQAAGELLDAVVEITPMGSSSRSGPALGFVIDASGLVVTLQDAVGDAKNVAVTLNDGAKVDAAVVGADAKTDLALLKLKTDRRLKVLHFGGSAKVTVGQALAGLANASVAEGLLKNGTVTALNQSLGVGPFDNFIAIDLAGGQPVTNKPVVGSGGPIFNEAGEVVGIHLATSAGKIFATPADDVVPIIDQLRRFGEVQRGWVGVQIQPVTDEIAESLNVKPPRGALVAETTDGGPAKSAGIEVGDVVVQFDAQEIKDPRGLARIVASIPIGKEVDVVVIRRGKEETHRLKIGRLGNAANAVTNNPGKDDPPAPKASIRQALGLELSSLSADLRQKFKVREDIRGVIVTRVDANSAAASVGLSPGDVIVELGMRAVVTPSDVQDRIDQLKTEGRKAPLLLVANADGQRFVTLRLP